MHPHGGASYVWGAGRNRIDPHGGGIERLRYNESLGGARTPTPSPVVVDALNDDGTIIKYVQNISTLAAPGQADDALMAFQHRMCISGDADRLPWKRPEGYNRDDFVLFERYIEASGGGFHGFGWPPQAMKDHGYPGKKDKYTLCCGISIAASDQPNLNKGWANATWDRKQVRGHEPFNSTPVGVNSISSGSPHVRPMGVHRACGEPDEIKKNTHPKNIPAVLRAQEIIADHTYFELGMFYFLSSDPKVPTAVRDEFNKYGLCADEFVEFGHIPPQLYIRESNRLVGDYVMTQNTLSGARTAPLNFPDGTLTKKSGKIFRVGIFLDFVWLTTRTMHPHGAYVRGARRNRIDRHGGGIERLALQASPSRTGGWTCT